MARWGSILGENLEEQLRGEAEEPTFPGKEPWKDCQVGLKTTHLGQHPCTPLCDFLPEPSTACLQEGKRRMGQGHT